MKAIVGLGMVCLAVIQTALGQVDTSYVYRTGTPYGTLDIRIAKSATRYYYLQENKTFSFRESSPGVKTNTFQDMTSWDSSPYTQGNLREKNGTADAFVMNYRLLFPQGYDPAYPDGYPLILMVHGAGERGNCWDYACHWADRTWKPQTNTPAAPTDPTHPLLNNDHNLLHGGEIHLQARNLAGTRLPNDPSMPSRAFPGFVLFPQNINGWDANGVQDMIRILRLITKKYHIDQNRIYIHGLSNGGYGVYEALKRAPWLFSAALPMSAISDAQLTSATYAPVLHEASNIPLWIFQGSLDSNPLPSKTRSYVKKYTDAGLIVRYNEYSNLGHGTWNTAYNEPDFFTWILSKNKANIHSFAGISAICLTNGQGVRMKLSEGFLAYQWERNGVIISGADTANYTADTPGVYRARFSRVANPAEAQWNRWSDPVTVTESNPAQAQVVQHGSIVLKDLNNYNDANLSAVGDYAHYYWYKNGTLVDLAGNEDDTTKNPIIKQGTCTDLPQCTGNGTYTLVTAGFDNCPSPPSEPLQIYFNNQAPISITAPSSFTGTSGSPSGASVNWTDNSSNENGFEIWKRKVITSTTFSRWSMSALTAPNVTSFNDEGLDPGSTYQYKIRAVGPGGRSNYTPSASNQFLVINTQADITPPSVPQNLTAVASGIRQITLNWQASTDNTRIANYIIHYNGQTLQTPDANTGFVMWNLDLNTNYSFTVSAVDLGNNESDPSNAANANTYMSGLYYEHSTGGWTDLDQIDWNVAEYKGKVPNFTLNPRTQEDYFNFEFDGYLYITTGGTYQFRTTSDDGSRLTLNGAVIVENDGLHGNVTVTSANQSLSSGPQLVNVKFFEYTGGQTLIVQYRGPDTGNNWINIPDAALKSGTPPPAPLAARAASGTQDKQTASPKTARISSVNIYPNPVATNESLSLSVEGESEEPVHVSIVDMMGESYYENTFNASDAENANLVTRRALRKGVYVLMLHQGDQVIKHRIVVKE
jgi:predicted esterase